MDFSKLQKSREIGDSSGESGLQARWSVIVHVYAPCTSLRRFCGFSPFCFFVESVSYAVSISPRGSTPTLVVHKTWKAIAARLEGVNARSL